MSCGKILDSCLNVFQGFDYVSFWSVFVKKKKKKAKRVFL